MLNANAFEGFNAVKIDGTDIFKVFESDDFKAFTGTPIFYQKQGMPTQTEIINRAGFDEGSLIFQINRLNDEISWLNDIDVSDNQTWAPFPLTAGNIEYIAALPVLQTLYWFTSDVDPTSDVPLPAPILEWTHGLLWWNRVNKTMFKMTAYDANTGIQVWTQII